MSKIYNRHHPQSFGLTNAWPMDELVGVDVFDIVDAASGTFSGSPSRIIHPKGYALRTSIGNYAVCGNVSALSNVTQFTMSAFVRRNATNVFGVFLGQGGSSSARVIMQPWNDGVLYFTFNTAYGFFSNSDTLWHHYTVVYDGNLIGNSNRLKAYQDGVQKTLSFSGTIPAVIAAITDNFRIGRDQANSQEGAGDIYDIRIYNKALDPAVIREIAFKPQELFVQPKRFIFVPAGSGAINTSVNALLKCLSSNSSSKVSISNNDIDTIALSIDTASKISNTAIDADIVALTTDITNKISVTTASELIQSLSTTSTNQVAGISTSVAGSVQAISSSATSKISATNINGNIVALSINDNSKIAIVANSQLITTLSAVSSNQVVGISTSISGLVTSLSSNISSKIANTDISDSIINIATDISSKTAAADIIGRLQSQSSVTSNQPAGISATVSGQITALTNNQSSKAALSDINARDQLSSSTATGKGVSFAIQQYSQALCAIMSTNGAPILGQIDDYTIKYDLRDDTIIYDLRSDIIIL